MLYGWCTKLWLAFKSSLWSWWRKRNDVSIYACSSRSWTWSWKLYNWKECSQSANWKILERLFAGCVSLYYNLFYYLEDQGVLDPTNNFDLFVLYYIFLPRINYTLECFRDSYMVIIVCKQSITVALISCGLVALFREMGETNKQFWMPWMMSA